MKSKSKIVGGVLLAGALALGSAGAAVADGPGDDEAATATPSVAQSVPAVGQLPLSGNQLSPVGTLLGG
ncbi:hypothetical protein ACFU3J_10900 [Streptomyces sp. NPDC057411]|uniref:hypothetical protein n=1 Tax=unclassified Streptomyces TaxID=2593676 RepID=UPI00363C8F48